MKSCARYIAESKAKLGDPRMSDRVLGEHLGGYIQQNIARAKGGYMTDPIAIAVAAVTGDDPGEVLLVARAERERDTTIRAHLMAYAKKALASVPSKAAAIVAAVALGMFLPARDAQALGGAGGIRTLEAGFAHLLP